MTKIHDTVSSGYKNHVCLTMFSERNVLIASGTYECSYSQRNYLVFWKFVPMADALIARVSYDVLITRVLITRVDCTH